MKKFNFRFYFVIVCVKKNNEPFSVSLKRIRTIFLYFIQFTEIRILEKI